MAVVHTPDGIRLHVEKVGAGSPVLFLHEFGGDHRSWEPQLRRFARRHRCVVYAARGYPPSDVPEAASSYSQDHAVADALAVLDGLDVERAHVVGLSMGAFTALHLARLHPERCRSAVVVGVGYGSPPDERADFQASCEERAAAFERDGAAALRDYGVAPSRLQFRSKDPRGHAEFVERLAEHSLIGSSRTLIGYQKHRPSLYEFREELAAMVTPVLLLVGDEDGGALETTLMLKRTVPTAALGMLPRSGHTLNLEEPTPFNALVGEFLATVDAGRWEPRVTAALPTAAVGLGDSA